MPNYVGTLDIISMGMWNAKNDSIFYDKMSSVEELIDCIKNIFWQIGF
jgi:hypothetical protein